MSANPFDDFISFVAKQHGEENWVTVYKNIRVAGGSEDGGMYCALVSHEKTEIALNQPGWDLMIGAGGPGFCTSYENGEKITSYYTNADEGYLRLVLHRDFHGRKDDYIEVLEEFRLFHNLYFQHADSTYLARGGSGSLDRIFHFISGAWRYPPTQPWAVQVCSPSTRDRACVRQARDAA